MRCDAAFSAKIAAESAAFFIVLLAFAATLYSNTPADTSNRGRMLKAKTIVTPPPRPKRPARVASGAGTRWMRGLNFWIKFMATCELLGDHR